MRGDVTVCADENLYPVTRTLCRAGWIATFLLPMLALAQTPVSVTSPRQEALTGTLNLSGTLTAERRAGLSPRVDGLVADVAVDAGDQVKAGDTLLSLDDALARQTLARLQAVTAQARATLDNAQRLVDEARPLVQDKHLPRSELANREAGLALAQAELAAARAAEREQSEILSRHRLPAPFDGVIVQRGTEAGEWVTRGTPVLELVATDRLRLDVQAPQEHYRELSDDSSVQVRLDALDDQTLPGRIVARVPVSDPASRTFLVRVVVDDPQHRLMAGSSATARFRVSGQAQARLVIPRDALLLHPDGGRSVFVVESDGEGLVARRRNVRIGRIDGTEAEILEGIERAARIVTRGNELLADGDAVTIAGT